MAERRVLDASAVLALFGDEPGADRVGACVPGAIVGAVNLCEVLTVLTRKGVSEASAVAIVRRYGLEVRDFTREQAVAAARLCTPSNRHLSLGDRACLALAADAGVPVLTAETAWRNAHVDGVEVELIR